MEKIGVPRHKNLVYTCAGDRSNIRFWMKGKRNFDLWVNYYGDQRGRYRDMADFYIARKGKKFPNLHYIYQNKAELLSHYEAVFVADDDIIIDGSKISRLFDIRAEYDLWILQPAFYPWGRISHPITQARPWSFMRYTNFVEVTCPLFRKDKLDQFMQIYDPRVVGWGVDLWFLDFLGPDLEGKAAVVDAVACTNPYEYKKGSRPETDELQYAKYHRDIQKAFWEKFSVEHNIKNKGQDNFRYKN